MENPIPRSGPVRTAAAAAAASLAAFAAQKAAGMANPPPGFDGWIEGTVLTAEGGVVTDYSGLPITPV